MLILHWPVNSELFFPPLVCAISRGGFFLTFNNTNFRTRVCVVQYAEGLSLLLQRKKHTRKSFWAVIFGEKKRNEKKYCKARERCGERKINGIEKCSLSSVWHARFSTFSNQHKKTTVVRRHTRHSYERKKVTMGSVPTKISNSMVDQRYGRITSPSYAPVKIGLPIG